MYVFVCVCVRIQATCIHMIDLTLTGKISSEASDESISRWIINLTCIYKCQFRGNLNSHQIHDI